MLFDDIRRDIGELIRLVREDEQYCASVKHGEITPTTEMHRHHQARAERITAIRSRLGVIDP